MSKLSRPNPNSMEIARNQNFFENRTEEYFLNFFNIVIAQNRQYTHFYNKLKINLLNINTV